LVKATSRAACDSTPREKKRRRYFGRPNYDDSTWGRMLRDERTADPESAQGYTA
jgi:hypothetical protein